MRSRAPAIVLFAMVSTGVVGATACGTDAVGVEACREVERARCRRAPSCGIDLSRPVHRDAPERDVTECVRFYEDACLHGLANPVDPGTIAVQACVQTIKTADCEIVKAPETHPSCAFLIPPAEPPPAPPPVDAGADGDAQL